MKDYSKRRRRKTKMTDGLKTTMVRNYLLEKLIRAKKKGNTQDPE